MKQIDQPSCDTTYILCIARGCNHSQPVHFVQIHSFQHPCTDHRTVSVLKEASFLSSLLKQILKEHSTNSEGLATLWVSGSLCWNNSCNSPHFNFFLQKKKLVGFNLEVSTLFSINNNILSIFFFPFDGTLIHRCRGQIMTVCLQQPVVLFFFCFF